MMYIIKWKTEPARGSQSWFVSIYNAREEIRDIQKETPSLTDSVIRDMWKKCFCSARREAEGETNRKTFITELSWEEVFDIS